MSVFKDSVVLIESFSTYVPLELYTLIASFIEEVIAPIPSPFVMTSAGSIARAQGKAMFALLLIAVVGAIGKTLGAWVLYVIADKGEDVIIKKYGRFFGVSHREIESIGKHFSGGIKDDLILTAMRAVPILPSAPISIVCGVIKLNIRTYLTSTFIGTIFRNLLFLYFGYAGLGSYESIVKGLESVESLMQVGLAALLGIIIIVIYWKRHKHSKSI